VRKFSFISGIRIPSRGAVCNQIPALTAFKPVDKKYGYPSTSSKILLESVRMENAMIPTEIGNRIVVIAGGTPATKKIRQQVRTEVRPTTRRIVLIKNGEWIGNKPMPSKPVE
jgi:hypothetical protein